MNQQDPLHEGLQALESDLLRVRMAGPEAARRRGQQHVRRCAATVAGALVIVVGAAVLGPVNSIFGTDGAPSPVGPATRVEPTAVPTATATAAATPAPTFTDDVLLEAADLEPPDAGWEEIGTPWASEGPFACAQGGSEDAADVLMRSFVPSDEGRVDQVVERYDSPRQAEARFQEIRSAVADCATGLDAETGGPPEFWQLNGVGNAAWIAGYWTPETAGETRRRVEIGAVRTGTAVTHVVWGFFAQDSIAPVVTDVTSAATRKLCGAAAGACVSEGTLVPIAEALEQSP